MKGLICAVVLCLGCALAAAQEREWLGAAVRLSGAGSEEWLAAAVRLSGAGSEEWLAAAVRLSGAGSEEGLEEAVRLSGSGADEWLEREWLAAAVRLSGAGSEEALEEQEVERYERLAARPLCINLARRSQLLSSGLFSSYQVASLLDYRARSGDILSAMELSLVDGFADVDALRYFVDFRPSVRQGIGDGRDSLEVGVDAMLRAAARRNGDASGACFGSKVCVALGGRGEIFLSARDTYAESVLGSGLSAASLAGGAAYYGRKALGKVVVGDFNARFGQGLVLWSGFSMSGFSSAAGFARHPSGVSLSHSFTTPLRGVAADFILGRTTISVMASVSSAAGSRAVGDQASVTSVASRSATDALSSLALGTASVRGSYFIDVLALNGTWFGRRGQAGATVAYSSSKRSLSTSLDARASFGRFDFFGEVAGCYSGGGLDLISAEKSTKSPLEWAQEMDSAEKSTKSPLKWAREADSAEKSAKSPLEWAQEMDSAEKMANSPLKWAREMDSAEKSTKSPLERAREVVSADLMVKSPLEWAQEVDSAEKMAKSPLERAQEMDSAEKSTKSPLERAAARSLSDVSALAADGLSVEAMDYAVGRLSGGGAAFAAVGGVTFNPSYGRRISLLGRVYPAVWSAPMAAGPRSSTKTSDEVGVALGVDWSSLTLTFDAAAHPSKGTRQFKALAAYSLDALPWLRLSPRATLRYRPQDGLPLRADVRLDTDLTLALVDSLRLPVRSARRSIFHQPIRQPLHSDLGQLSRLPLRPSRRGDLLADSSGRSPLPVGSSSDSLGRRAVRIVPMPPLNVRWRVEAVRCNEISALTYVEAGFKDQVSAYLRGSIFIVDNWDDRIYCYERDIPGSFTVPAYYGRGWSLSLICGRKWHFGSWTHAVASGGASAFGAAGSSGADQQSRYVRPSTLSLSLRASVVRYPSASSTRQDRAELKVQVSYSL